MAYTFDNHDTMTQEDIVVESTNMYEESHLKVVEEPRPKSTCLYFLKGNCNFGEKCDFHHPHNMIPRDVPRCNFFQRGKCKYGNRCIYIHEAKNFQEEKNSVYTVVKSQKKEKPKVKICKNCGAYYDGTCAFCEDENVTKK